MALFLLTHAAVAFHFCRVGDDEGALEMLEHLDDCSEVGEYVDCLPGAYAPEILYFLFSTLLIDAI